MTGDVVYFLGGCNVGGCNVLISQWRISTIFRNGVRMVVIS